MILSATAIFLLARNRQRVSATPGFLLLASAGACAGCGIQHAGFAYHRVPQNSFLELAIVCIAIELTTRWLPALFAPASITRL